jgi:hypothetical protein
MTITSVTRVPDPHFTVVFPAVFSFSMMISPADGPKHSHHEVASMPHPVIPALDEDVDDGEPEQKRAKGGFKVR